MKSPYELTATGCQPSLRTLYRVVGSVLAVAGFVVLVVSARDADLTGNALCLAWCAAMSLVFFGSARSYVLVGSEEITVCNWWRERRVSVLGTRATTTTGFPGNASQLTETVLRPICLYGAGWSAVTSRQRSII